MTEEKPLIAAVKGKTPERVPFWFMRQAGRYLPEYREIRGTEKRFLDLCLSPEKAAEITLQPLRRFGMDGAILFSDILVVPHGMGVEINFTEGEGPNVSAVDTGEKIAALNLGTVRKKLAPVAETIRLVKQKLPEEATLIGFAGAPWTVACYMLQGKPGKEFARARSIAYAHPGLMHALMERLTTATIDYLLMQIEAGAEAIQIFDSWAGLLTPEQFGLWVTTPTKKIAAALRAAHPEIPIIGFAKGTGMQLATYAKETGVNCLGIDQHTPMEYALSCRAYPTQAVQGNLDPLLLAFDLDGAKRETENILRKTANRPRVFNVGHGFIPATPIEHVQAISDMVKAWRD